MDGPADLARSTAEGVGGYATADISRLRENTLPPHISMFKSLTGQTAAGCGDMPGRRDDVPRVASLQQMTRRFARRGAGAGRGLE